MRTDLPIGTVTFLITDVEGSTELLRELGAETYAEALGEHRRIVRAVVADVGGVEVDTQGDAFFFAFSSAPGAVSAAQAIIHGLLPGPINLRIGLHTGTPLVTDEGYVGDDVHFAARVAAAGHGGQVLLSKASRELVGGLSLTDLGEHRLKDIEGAVSIYQLGSQRFPPLKTISNTNLPRLASSFVGRARERDELLSLVRSGSRLVTLAGPGGCGKTRLALEVASELLAAFKEGVFWVGLAPLRDPAVVRETIAQTLGAKEGLAEHVGERKLLLLLDNFEQVVEVAPELSQLLEACPHLSLLVTSRELLRIRGEVEYRVSPLAEPEAVELFCERARLEPDETIVELCRRLDDMPLALELAAARTRVLTPAQILDRLAHRLDLLKGGRDADPRQQTLRATIEWSYDLLDEAEKQLFARLAVFAGGCTFEAAEEVCDADVDVLQSLLDKSLLRHVGDRFWMLETVREYALERLDNEHAVEGACGAYAEYYLALARKQISHFDHGELDALHALERDLDNFLAAFAWSQSPEKVPTPIDDGACHHLLGVAIPSLVLESSQGPVDLADLAAERLVLYIYPGTTRPGRPPLPGLYALPGGRGCTAESRAFRDHAAELAALGAQVAGLSVQTLGDQLEFADRAQMPFPLIADPRRQLETVLRAATFEVDEKTLYRRATLIAEHGTITKVFYPVFPPDRNATDVLDWLSAHT